MGLHQPGAAGGEDPPPHPGQIVGGGGPSFLSESRLPSSTKITFSDQDHHFRLCSTRHCHGSGGGEVSEETKGGGADQPLPNPHLHLFRGNHKAENLQPAAASGRKFFFIASIKSWSFAEIRSRAPLPPLHHPRLVATLAWLSKQVQVILENLASSFGGNEELVDRRW